MSELCDQVRGQCACRSEVAGRRCDRCQTGFWGFPFCRPCECNGLSEVCDEQTGECLNCREHATGPNCDRFYTFLYIIICVLMKRFSTLNDTLVLLMQVCGGLLWQPCLQAALSALPVSRCSGQRTILRHFLPKQPTIPQSDL